MSLRVSSQYGQRELMMIPLERSFGPVERIILNESFAISINPDGSSQITPAEQITRIPVDIIANRNGEIQFYNTLLLIENNKRLFAPTQVMVASELQGSIQKAINPIVDSSSTKPYKIQIPAGIYTGNITPKGYIGFQGAGHQITSVQPTATNGVVINTTCSNKTVEFRDMEFLAGGAVLCNITATGATINFVNCRIKANGSVNSVVYTKAASLGNTLNFIGCQFDPNGSYTMKILDSASPASVTDKVYVIGCFFGTNCDIGTESGGITVKKTGSYSALSTFINDENVDKVDGYDATDLLQSPASTVTNETAYDISAAVGSSLLYARGDHTHGTPAAQQWGD
ncbi:MAG: hypothetical protein QME51_05680, partial [Planctomycetota bacterium]|nr:hypothetical protein [Planctomycetota bacterium]